ncbi:hypothetical protein N7539_003296 [Penicillium diatomitis]|uniref:Uncharacterized protein n=1 Tax=Penicillium diatomitis TaxID=2819901 RepID=A0A9X0BZP4_9EURO|nr:uncharacterized protein N7539_003296 [Penicillium diatomitis]KAJ5491729.1 hypothetical protein N7539_003296 [Penicillium diatomitis]
MDDSNVLTILASISGWTFGVLVVIVRYTWSLLYSLLYVIAWPVLSVGRGLLSVALFPLRVLLKFEAFLTFVLGAAIVGATVGLCLYLAGDFLSRVLLLHSPELEEPLMSRSMKLEDSSTSFDWESKMYMSSTILEEEETSQDSRD